MKVLSEGGDIGGEKGKVASSVDPFFSFFFFEKRHRGLADLRLLPIYAKGEAVCKDAYRERRLPYIYCLRRHPPRFLRVTTLYLILGRLRIRIRIIGVVKPAVNNIK